MALSLFNRVLIIGVIVAVVVGGWFLYYRERNNFAEYRTATIAAAKAQQERTDLIAKHQTRITKKAEENHAQNVASIRSVYDGLRRSNGGSTLSTVLDTIGHTIFENLAILHCSKGNVLLLELLFLYAHFLSNAHALCFHFLKHHLGNLRSFIYFLLFNYPIA